jgi:hypothetical protein
MVAKPGKEELLTELMAELRMLRQQVREVGEGFIIRKEGEIEALIGYLAPLTARQLRTVARSWLPQARNLDCKPAKGRLKDLKRLDGLLTDLLDNLIELQRDDETRSTGKEQAARNRKPAVLPSGAP